MKKNQIDFKSADEAPKKTVMTLGCFDGIHLGHQKIIKDIQTRAKKNQAKSCLCIFDPHPSQILKPSQKFKRIFTLKETEFILNSYDLDHFCIIPFDLDFSKLSPKNFIYNFIKKQFDPCEIVVGYDFSFGFQRQGTFSYLKKQAEQLGFKVSQLPALSDESQIVSSSLIKKKLSLGEMKQVNQFLGRPFFIHSKVIKGEGRGHEIGFPTANLFIEKNKQLPKRGVYACRVDLGDGVRKKAVMNLGVKPSVSSKNELSVEVHIIGENKQLYGHDLLLEISHFIREERLFSNISDLAHQIQKDLQEV